MIRPKPTLLLLAMLYPSAAAWLYFYVLAGSSQARWAYLGAKVVQFLLPLLALRAARSRQRFGRRRLARWGSAALGVVSGLLLAALTWLGFLALEPTLAAAGVGERIAAKLADFGIAGVDDYLLLAFGLSVVHSALEEFYWRWLVFGGLLAWMRWPMALTLSSLAFTAHHVLVISWYAQGRWPLVVVGSLAVLGGGALWAWLVHKRGSLLGPWISHLIADGALMAVGYSLVWG